MEQQKEAVVEVEKRRKLCFKPINLCICSSYLWLFVLKVKNKFLQTALVLLKFS